MKDKVCPTAMGAQCPQMLQLKALLITSVGRALHEHAAMSGEMCSTVNNGLQLLGSLYKGFSVWGFFSSVFRHQQQCTLAPTELTPKCRALVLPKDICLSFS